MYIDPITPLSKYDFGYLRGGGIAFPASGSSYYGPPHSFWYPLLLAIIKYGLLIGTTLIIGSS